MNDRLNESVAARLEALLARCDRIRLARDLDRPTTFDREGERHAESVAERDAASHTETAPRGVGRFQKLRS